MFLGENRQDISPPKNPPHFPLNIFKFHHLEPLGALLRNFFHGTKNTLSFLCFSVQRKENPQKTTIFYPYRTSKIPGKKNKEFLARRENKEIPKKKQGGKEGQGIFSPRFVDAIRNCSQLRLEIWIHKLFGFQRTPKGGGQKRGGGQNLSRRPPTENGYRPPHLSMFCPPPMPFLLVSPLEIPRISLS